MQLSKRLKAVADLVTKGNRVADVGCDHAYISIYLAENEISPHIIAMDVNQGPIDRARENIIKYGCDGLIEVRKSDGLDKLKEDEADTIIIAGMGGALTVQILTQYPENLNSIRELILQPQSEIYKVRQLLSECSFIIVDEAMVKEDGKYYFMMKAMRRANAEIQDAEIQDAYQLDRKEYLYFGKLLLEKKNPILKEYLLWDYGICEEIIRSLQDAQSENSRQKQKEIEERMELIQAGLNYFN